MTNWPTKKLGVKKWRQQKSFDAELNFEEFCKERSIVHNTLLTNEARDKAMTQIIQAKKSAGLSGTTIFDPFDPRPELKGVFDGYLRDASRKFKNIKENC